MKKNILGLLTLLIFIPQTVYATTKNSKTTDDVTFYSSDTGSLTILDIPTIQFGSQVLLDENQTFKSATNGEIKVRDDRSNKSDWRLQVTQLGEFSNGKSTLKNSVIKYGNKKLLVGVPFDIWINNTSDKQIVEIPTSNFSLFMPAGAADEGGNYSAEINWSLSDGVGNE